jgi:hypothetical protein
MLLRAGLNFTHKNKPKITSRNAPLDPHGKASTNTWLKSPFKNPYLALITIEKYHDQK